jgi:DNA-binding NarL/FixJ family response regulator
MFRILLVQQHNTVREALAFALSRQPDFEVVGRQPATLAQGRFALAQGAIDLAVIDSSLSEGDGLDLVREVRDAQPHSLLVLVLTTSLDRHANEVALKAGASEVLTTEASFEEIFSMIRRIAEEY